MTTLEAFLAEKTAARRQAGVNNLLAAEVSGPKYVRVFQVSGSSRSALYFINRSTGEVHESASWKQPKRGTVAGVRVAV